MSKPSSEQSYLRRPVGKSRTARIIEIITPGAFAPYFQELARTLNAGGPPDQEKLAETARKYGLTYQMEWVPALKAKYNLKLLGE